MAQDFVGSNNINLLEPGGQFGTRMAGGKDAASPRYIFTRLSPISRLLFPDVDDPLLDHLEDDGVMIEPKFFCPIVPLLLVNGAQGIGTGWSTSIPQHNIRDVLEHVRSRLNGEEILPSINPWVRGFTGNISISEDKNGYRSVGCADVSISFQFLEEVHGLYFFYSILPAISIIECNRKRQRHRLSFRNFLWGSGQTITKIICSRCRIEEKSILS